MTPDLGRFKKTLIYSRRAPIDALLEDLDALRAFDRGQEKVLRLWTIVGVVGLLLLGVVFVLSLAPPRPGHAAKVPWPLLFGLSGAMAVVGFVVRITHSRRNLEDRRYVLAERVLRFLRRDTRPEAEVFLEIDFRRPNIKPKHVGDGQVGPWSVKHYTDRWLKVRGRLLDGTAYQLDAIEKHQARRKTYRGRSGKTKSKSKTKSAAELVLGLKVKTRRYPRLHALHGLTQEAREAVRLPEWAALKAYHVHAPEGSEVGTLVLRSATKQDWSCAPAGQPEGPTSGVRWFALTFLSLYQVLNYARAPKKA